MAAAPAIDTVLLACTHYPVLIDKIKKHLPAGVNVVSQGDIVAASLADYLHRHTELDNILTKTGTTRYYTTDDTTDFDNHASIFRGVPVKSQHISLQ